MAIPDHPIKRLWQRNEPSQRVGVEVVGPECNVVIDVYEEKSDTVVGFMAEEWDEIVKLVSERRRDILTRLNRVVGG